MGATTLCSVKRNYIEQIRGKDDEEVLENIRNSERWCECDRAIHRYYLRLLRQEAHRRGLKT